MKYDDNKINKHVKGKTRKDISKTHTVCLMVHISKFKEGISN
jgi:hypothetical protein